IMHATKETYLPGETSLVLGSTNANALLSLEMSDPNGKIIKQKDIFSDKDGKFSDGTFRVPSDATEGAWMIKAKSGANYAEAKFTVSGTIDKTFTVKVDKASYIRGDLMIISGTGGGKTQTATATISDQNGVKITDLSSFSTSAGSFQITWKVPTDMVPGTYKIKATIGTDVAETTFTVQ
ncbi:MAG: biofilm-associated protein, partial [Thaumarchaeota archaeon]|nr:biofilm-associated protein [Nitrososphaerota archaeon]